MTLDRRQFLIAAGSAAAAATLLNGAPAATAKPRPIHGTTKVTVATGETWGVSRTTRLSVLVVEDGGIITAPSGSSVTLTVNGIEQGSKLVATGGDVTRIVPGTYRRKPASCRALAE